jgi:hypothetical protein
MTLEEIIEAWQVDGNIDMTNLSRESAQIPFLHNKYYSILIKENLKLKRLHADHKRLIGIKTDYYRGDMDPIELKERGWNPFPLRVVKSDISTYVERDDDIINSGLKIGYVSEVCSYLESILKMIHNRNYQLKLILDNEKFKNGIS